MTTRRRIQRRFDENRTAIASSATIPTRPIRLSINSCVPRKLLRGTHEFMESLIGLVGIVALLAIAVLFSSNRRWIRLRVVIPAFLLQAGFALLVLGTPWGRNI